MIAVCVADNFPVVHFGVKAYFKDHSEVAIVANIGDFSMVREILQTKRIDVLLLDLQLEGLSSIIELKILSKEFSKTKIIIYTSLTEKIYAPNVIKAGACGFINKTAKLAEVADAIVKVNQGKIIMDETIRKNLERMAKKKKNERLYRKLSNREIEVLRYLSIGKKNLEIANILNLNEKTISTYKLRLLAKLNVTNLIDLINQAKTLEIV